MRSSSTHQHADEQTTSHLIQQTWAEVLGLAAVEPDDDFFDLGGNSLVVAAAMARLNERLGLDLPLRALFEAPTPAEMAELIAEQRAKRDGDTTGAITPFLPSWVIPLQRAGSGTPVFVFPAGHDEMRALSIDAQIASHVGKVHPFWGFRREDAALTHARADGVPMLAAEYVRQIRAIQPGGPYLLFGNCAGAYLAWETARQLLAAGDEVARILFYEAPLRADFDRLMLGVTPAHASREWHLSLYFRPVPLPVDVTHLMTDDWQARGWWQPWQRVVTGTLESVIIPVGAIGGEAFLARRQELIAGHVRGWIERTEARVRRP